LEYFWQLNVFVNVTSHRRYPNFDVVLVLAWSNDPESYTDNSDATGMIPHVKLLTWEMYKWKTFV